MHYRFANSTDAALLAPLNAELIRDEGHRNSMTLAELERRMAGWLTGEYRAALFEESEQLVGYALFRRDPEMVSLRQLYIRPEFRRRGHASAAIAWLWRHAWDGAPLLRIDVLVDNAAARAFWRAVGFREYSITLEMEPPIRGR